MKRASLIRGVNKGKVREACGERGGGIRSFSSAVVPGAGWTRLPVSQPLLVLEDPKHSLAEKRWAAFGRTDSGRLLVVVFTQRGSLIRVISARDMNSRERKFYEGNE